MRKQSGERPREGGGNPKRILFSQLSWVIFFPPAESSYVPRRRATDRVIKERAGYACICKGPWELDHLCGLPRAVFTLR